MNPKSLPDSLNPGLVQSSLLCRAFSAQADALSLAEPLRVVSRAREEEEGFSVTQGIAEVLPKLHNQTTWGSEDTKVTAGVVGGVTTIGECIPEKPGLVTPLINPILRKIVSSHASCKQPWSSTVDPWDTLDQINKPVSIQGSSSAL